MSSSVYYDDLELFAIGPEQSAGDLNCDSEINAIDIEPFLLALFEPQSPDSTNTPTRSFDRPP